MTVKVTLVDYGIGNLYSVRRALECVGADVLLSSNPMEIEAAERLVLPGVGAFEDGMAGLTGRGLVDPVRRHAASGRPLMGICLGMQMLASVSEEFGLNTGLGLIPGRVTAISGTTTEGLRQKIPHVGWSALLPSAAVRWEGTALADTAPGSSVYLVHSFQMVPDEPVHRLAEYEYGGHRITAAVGSGRIIGCQFHPEKSGPVGLDILRRFLAS